MRVVITAGGTGGHIYPALAIIRELEKRGVAKEDILYIGTSDRMEKDIVPKLQYSFIGLELKGLNRSNIFKNFKVIYLYQKAYKKALNIIKNFKADVVIGVGGYITLPVVKAAQNLKIPTFIHEQNIIPGLANKILARKATLVGVSLEESLKYFKNNALFTGNPVAEDAVRTKKLTKKDLGFDNKKLVLIVMGSLGSETINKELKTINKKLNSKYNYILVTGKNYYDDFDKKGIAKVVPYLDNMKEVMTAVDLIVSRAGASTIAEITALGVPSILVPSPYVTHNHQVINAKILEDKGASKILYEKDFKAENLNNLIDEILSNNKLYKKMVNNNLDLSKVNSASLIAEKILSIAKKT